MTNTPTPRPDVEGIKARANHIWGIQHRRPPDWPIDTLVSEDVPALITYIEALEARQEKLEAVVEFVKAGVRTGAIDTALAALDGGDDGAG